MLTAPACPYRPLNRKHLNTLIICFMLLYLKNRMRQRRSVRRKGYNALQPGYGRHPDNLQGYLSQKSHRPHIVHIHQPVLSMMCLSYSKAVCATWTFYSSVFCLWTWMLYKRPFCLWTFMCHRCRCCPWTMWTCLFDSNLCCPRACLFSCRLWCPWTCLSTAVCAVHERYCDKT